MHIMGISDGAAGRRGRAHRHLGRLALALLLTLGAAELVGAGPLRDRLAERRAARQEAQGLEQDEARDAPVVVPAGVQVIRNIAYGSDPLQRFDVYKPVSLAPEAGAPVVLMVHGGGWRRGDKGMATVVQNKMARWVPRGIVFVSVNYRMLPAADPLEQARDVARALAAAQKGATSWGGDPRRFVLMGHSAGAHLVALLATSSALAQEAGAQTWLGTVSLDSAALDVPEIMERRHPKLYDAAFGSDPAAWRAASPMHRLMKSASPFLAVCSSRRRDACPPAVAFAAKANALGMRTVVHQENLSHKEINARLGEPGPYTEAVESFLRSLDAELGRRLGAAGAGG